MRYLDSITKRAIGQPSADFATVFPDCTEGEKERLLEFILKKAVVQKDKVVDFGF